MYRTRIGLTAMLLVCVMGAMTMNSLVSGQSLDVLTGEDLQLAPEMEYWISEMRQEAGLHIGVFGDLRLVLIALGERPTAGHEVKVLDVGQQGGLAWIIDVATGAPADDEPVAQVISYPYALVALRDDGLPIRVRDAGSGELLGAGR